MLAIELLQLEEKDVILHTCLINTGVHNPPRYMEDLHTIKPKFV